MSELQSHHCTVTKHSSQPAAFVIIVLCADVTTGSDACIEVRACCDREGIALTSIKALLFTRSRNSS